MEKKTGTFKEKKYINNVFSFMKIGNLTFFISTIYNVEKCNWKDATLNS